MSRTRRRTRGKDRNWRTIESREWWEENREDYLSDNWRGKRIGWAGVEFNARWYHWEVSQFATYDHYKTVELGRYHWDRKSYGGGVPRSFRNSICERPFRAAHKQELSKAKKSGEWDAVMLKPFIRDAAWLYW